MVWCFCVMWKNVSLQLVFVSLVTAEIKHMTFPCTWMSKYSNTIYWIIYPFPNGSKCQNFSIFYVLIYIAHSSQFSWSSCLLLNQLMSNCFNYSFIIYRYLSQSFWAGVTEYHRLDSLIVNIYFSWFSQEVQGQSMIDLVSVESPLPGLQMITFSWYSLHDGEWNNLFHVSSYRGTNSIQEGSTLMTKPLPKASSPSTVTLAVRTSTYEFKLVGTQTFSP